MSFWPTWDIQVHTFIQQHREKNRSSALSQKQKDKVIRKFKLRIIKWTFLHSTCFGGLVPGEEALYFTESIQTYRQIEIFFRDIRRAKPSYLKSKRSYCNFSLKFSTLNNSRTTQYSIITSSNNNRRIFIECVEIYLP